MTRALATAFGLVMVAAAAVGADGPALVAAALSVAAVLIGIALRPAATAAVLLAAAVLVIDDAPAMLAALSGLAAVGYLVLRHAATTTGPTVIGAVGFTMLGLAAVSLPWQVPWLPLVAPVAVLGIVVLVTRPFWAPER